MNSKSGTILVFAVIFSLILPMAAIGSDEGRLPPTVKKYPGRGSPELTSYASLTLYTTDSTDKVIAFYRNSLNMDPVGEGKFLLGTDATYPDKPGHTDSDVWLKVLSARGARDTLKEGDLFGFLQKEIMVKKRRSEKELQQVKKKYAHLAQAWYPDFDVDKKLDSCAEETRSNVTASRERMPSRNKEQEEEMLAQMQQLMAQGRHREAAALAQKSARPGMETSRAMQQENKTDHWDEWLACLDEVDRHDFQTKIEIGLYHNRHFIPSTKQERKKAAAEETARSNEIQAR
ncbi:MAG: hypothetical protein RQ767_06560, partial [Thermovirgaceae bacterium]|nr:hypothetical protein [Thermovirgaceae bacterium]